MIKRIFLEKGIAYASRLALANFIDLEKVIDWNISQEVMLYRMSSDMIPWMSEFELMDMPDYPQIREILNRCGKKAAGNGLRLTYHPGPFNVLAAKNPQVVGKTIKELRQHAEIMDLMNLPASPFSKINIHVGGAYGDKKAALSRFAENFMTLSAPIRTRLTLENDDKGNMFSIKDLLWLHEQINIPLVFDFFHHQFCTGGLEEEEAFLASIGTWPEDIVPVVHFSSSKKIFEDPFTSGTAHADYLYQQVNLYQRACDVMFEAKAKDAAVVKYLIDFGRLW
jgi:UV DNA damage endonuclease